MKKNYESYIILDGNLEDNPVDELIGKYENLLKKNDVEIKNIDRIGRRRLAYAIKKKLNGYYICFEIKANPDFIAKLEKSYKLDENVLRYLNVYMDKRTMKEKDEYLKKKAAFAERAEEERKEVPKPEVKDDIAVNEESKENQAESVTLNP
jgi:small subunit ribosomal protein S6